MIDSHALATLGLRPTRLFEGFPYLVTRVVPSMYHVIVVPDDLRAEDLVEIARCQARTNHLPTCLVLRAASALYIGPDEHESWSDSPPTRGIILTDRLQPCRAFSRNHALTTRRLALERFAAETSPRHGYMFGDLTKGGRKPRLEEEVRLAGTQSNGVPRGLERCARCGEWQGRCLDPSPRFSGLVIDVYCRCANDNRCAACGGLLHHRKLNANYYDETGGHIWHVPGFTAFGHTCP
jgi:hypothetical protein